MKLYLYKTGENTPVMSFEDVISYTDNQVVTEKDGDRSVYSTFAPDCELSSLPDCSEALRADWRADHPSQEERVEELEALVAELLFGGENV